MLEVLPEFTGTPEFQQLATAFKRVKNIARDDWGQTPMPSGRGTDRYAALLTEPAELALVAELARRQPVIERVLESGDNYRQAFAEAAAFGPFVDRFFSDVFVMVEDPALRQARLHADDVAGAAHPPARGYLGDRSSIGVLTDHGKEAREEEVSEEGSAKPAPKKSDEAGRQERPAKASRRSTSISSAAARPTAIARMRDLLGGKGANLAEMTNAGLPVPARVHDHDGRLQAVVRQRPQADAGHRSRDGSPRPQAGEDRRRSRSARRPTRCWSRCARARSSRCPA